MNKARPNILVAIADDWAWPHAGAYGCRFISTPSFDRICREGVLFSNGFTTAPTCTASRASLLTGRHPWSLEAGAQLWGYLPAKYKVYPDILECQGYWVGHTNKGWGPGSIAAGGRNRNPAGPGFNNKTCSPLTKCMSKNDYAANFADFLENKPADAPFCFWYGSKEPHRFYEQGSGLRQGKRLEDVQVPFYLPDCEEVRSDLLDYALEVERFDADLGRMMDLLEKRGELDNTLIVVTGDNGKPFPRSKATGYEHGCHVPLAVRGAGTRPGRVVSDFISFIDLAPTFLELAGIALPDAMSGRSLVDVLRSGTSGRVDPSRDFVIIGRERHGYSRPWLAGYPIRSIVTDNYIYVRNFEPDRWPTGNPERYGDCDDSPSKSYILAHRHDDPERFNLCFGLRPGEELYHRPDDSECVRNLLSEPEHEKIRAELRAKLEGVLKEIGDPRISGRGWQFECVPYIRHAAPNENTDFPAINPELPQDHFIPEGEKLDFEMPCG